MKEVLITLFNYSDGIKLEHSPITGKAKLFDCDGNLLAETQLKQGERAWGIPDPKAEMYYSFSPYNYVLNNPINAIDPDGKRVMDWLASLFRVEKRHNPNETVQNLEENHKEKAVIEVTKRVKDKVEEAKETIKENLPNADDSPKEKIIKGAVVALGVSQADSPVPGPADAIGAGIFAISVVDALIDFTSISIDNFAKKKKSSDTEYSTKDQEHTKGKRKSQEGTHEKGRARNKQDKGGEKGDAKRTRYK